jgi:hypothetical protein
MIDGDAWEPLESRGDDEVVIPYTGDGRVGVEPRENGVAETHHTD